MITEYYTTRHQFEGFYESNYYHSDMEYNYNEMMDDESMPKNKHYELTRFKQYQRDLCKEWIDLVKYQLETSTGNVIKKISTRKFRLDSPKYYNFETDKLVIKIEFSKKALELWCFTTKADKFNEYLKEHYSSYSGFISFISNNIDDFKHDYFFKYLTFKDRERNNLYNVMLEFYLNCQIDFELDVNEQIRYWQDENLGEYMKLVKN